MTGRYRAERSTHLPKGAINVAHVHDFETGAVARRDDGRLAYFPSMAAAERWAANRNAEPAR